MSKNKELVDYKKLGKAVEMTSSSSNSALSLDDRVAKHDADIAKTISDLGKLNQFMFYVVIILLVMVAGIVITYLADNTNATKQLQQDKYEFVMQKIKEIEDSQSLK